MNTAALGSTNTPSPAQGLPRFEAGDRILDFLRVDQAGQPQAFYEYPKGKIVILAVVTKLPPPPNVLAILKALSTQYNAVNDVCILALVPQAAAANAALKAELDLQFPIWSDDGTITTALTQGSSQSSLRILVLDANLRIRDTLPNKKVKAAPDAIVAVTETTIIGLRSHQPPRQIQTLAPVLLVPNVMDALLCKQLIKAHDQGKTFSSGMVRQIDGKRQMLQEADTKRRIDHMVEDPTITRTVTDLLARRLLPEMKKAFHFEPSNLEGLKIVRYDGKDQGFFSPHRDNNTQEVARRRFALTLNLNAPDTYKGGALRFPEYGLDLYRPAPGEALVFSCSHLHEVTPVTRGSRYVLITFFLK
ncbi:MAG: 2OG-Fe(II) oxygenase [Cyanothece sp. SIO1E1]|nr:2OG-Fe(II) oxygenase [Cyanothece sp. SIO1E1]